MKIVIGTVVVLLSVVAVWLNADRVVHGWLALPSSVDAFGAVNTLFSGLAFAGVVAAVLLQREELQQQRKELEATTKALENQVRLMRDGHMFQVLTGILLEYRKPEMMNAIAALWGLHRAAGAANVVTEYARLQAQGGPLHEQRRLVSQFYDWLAGLHDLKLVSPDVLYRYWSKADLQIIPDILLPIESHLGGGVMKPNMSAMKRLYDEAV